MYQVGIMAFLQVAGEYDEVSLVNVEQDNSKDTSNKVVNKPKRLSLNKGLKVWKEKGMSGVRAEIAQIHMRNVFQPQDARKLSYD